MRAALTLAALLASQSQAACLWTDPGANRFTGDPVAAVNSYADIPPQARAELAEAVGQRAYSEVVDITRSACINCAIKSRAGSASRRTRRHEQQAGA